MTTNREIPNMTEKRRWARVQDVPDMPRYNWLSHSSLRHLIFNSADRTGSGGSVIPGNGLAPAIIRIGRKVLIDLDAFDAWVESHRATNWGASK